MGIFLNYHKFICRYTPCLCYASDIVSPQINKHYMLCNLLWVFKKLFLQPFIFSIIFAARSGTCNRPDINILSLHPYKYLSGRANKFNAVKPHVKHIGRRIYNPERPVDIKWLYIKPCLKSLGQDYLNTIPCLNILLCLKNTIHKLFLGKVRNYIFVRCEM